MANSISYAKQYINNQKEVLRMFNTNLLCADLLRPLAEHKGKYVAYDRISFGDYSMGNYNRDSGLQKKDFTFERIEKTLSQDRGDTLALDIMDKEEAQIADGIVGVFNFYNIKVVVPTIDSYAFGQFGAVNGTGLYTAHASLSSANIVEALFNDFAALKQKRVKTSECILYIAASKNALLEQAAFGKGIIEVGNWNGDLETTCTMVKGAKIVEVPDETLGEDVAWILVHPLAADVIPVLNAAEFKDNIPGFVGKAQVDVRYYFDAWVQPTGGDGIIVALDKPRDLTLVKGTNKVSGFTGVEKGAEIYYTTNGSTPTSSSTKYTSGDISVSANATIKAIQILDGVSSDVVSWTNA